MVWSLHVCKTLGRLLHALKFGVLWYVFLIRRMRSWSLRVGKFDSYRTGSAEISSFGFDGLIRVFRSSVDPETVSQDLSIYTTLSP